MCTVKFWLPKESWIFVQDLQIGNLKVMLRSTTLDCLPLEISGTSLPHQNSLEWSGSHSHHKPPEYCNIDRRILGIT